MTAKKKNYQYFIGIDVSKHTLDLTMLKDQEMVYHEQIPNLALEVVAFIKKLKATYGLRLSKAIFCMEQSGFYSNILLGVLLKMKADVVVDNALRIKNSMGMIRGKDDKTDSLRIARYARTHREQLTLWKPKRPALAELHAALSLRERLLGVSVILKTPLKEQQIYINKNLHKVTSSACERTMTGLQSDLEHVEQYILQIISRDPNLKRLNRIVTSVPQIGLITSSYIIVYSNEFLDISSAKKFACYAGVVPFKKESGLSAGKGKVSHTANKRMKSLLHLCSMGARRNDPELKSYFERKTKEGKPGMLVINNIKNKLIGRVFSCVKKDQEFVRDYAPFKEQTADELNHLPG